MYIWKTGSLSKDIKNGSVQDKDWMNYFLWVSILMVLGMYVTMLSPRSNLTAMAVEAIAVIGITIFGVSITYDTNRKGGGTGVNYNARFTAKSLPILIKLFVLSVIFGIILVVVNQVASLTPDDQEWAFAIFTIVVQALYFWRINSHLKIVGSSFDQSA